MPLSDVSTRSLPTLHEFFAPGGILARSPLPYEYRPGQLEMAKAVERALAEQRHLIVEAGTGTGKTLAYLLPALRTGHRVWVVGELSTPTAGKTAPPDPPIAPNGPLGWSDQPYTEAWGNQMSYLLVQHATNITLLVDPVTNTPPVNPMERMALISVSGWATNNP